jgi:hypothetical protein
MTLTSTLEADLAPLDSNPDPAPAPETDDPSHPTGPTGPSEPDQPTDPKEPKAPTGPMGAGRRL